jgi:hypothetical protein
MAYLQARKLKFKCGFPGCEKSLGHQAERRRHENEYRGTHKSCSKKFMFNQKTGQIGCNLPTKVSAISKREKVAQLVGLIRSKFDTLDSNATSKTSIGSCLVRREPTSMAELPTDHPKQSEPHSALESDLRLI